MSPIDHQWCKSGWKERIFDAIPTSFWGCEWGWLVCLFDCLIVWVIRSLRGIDHVMGLAKTATKFASDLTMTNTATTIPPPPRWWLWSDYFRDESIGEDISGSSVMPPRTTTVVCSSAALQDMVDLNWHQGQGNWAVGTVDALSHASQ